MARVCSRAPVFADDLTCKCRFVSPSLRVRRAEGPEGPKRNRAFVFRRPAHKWGDRCHPVQSDRFSLSGTPALLGSGGWKEKSDFRVASRKHVRFAEWEMEGAPK